jgi:cyclohexanone monooxygenase
MTAAPPSLDADVLDVLIVGAGLSGIGAACHLARRCPGKRYAILEARDTIGGTWDLFRYPGVRSDSDMYTLGYAFQPWRGTKAIADGPAIRAYIEATAREHGVKRHIRFGHKVIAASWSSRLACWTIDAEHAGERRRFQARFLYMCSGYYRYDQAYRPAFEGEADFGGAIVAPQFWPQSLDYAGKRVVVIGSGATAVTLVPALAEQAAHVTMLQRSPTYVVSRPSTSRLARLIGWLPARAAHALTRTGLIAENMLLFWLARRKPTQVGKQIIAMARRQLGPACDADTHFTPRYKPWDQRLCIAADGDLFRTIRSGRADVVTDRIARFSQAGIVLESGRELAADIVVMATGLQIQLLGGVAITVDGRDFDANQSLSYRGLMLSDLPNCALTLGYLHASWTLKADLTATFICRLLRHMDKQGAAIAVPRAGPEVERRSFRGFSAGYLLRARSLLPQQGPRPPWRVYQSYLHDLLTLRYGRMDDGCLRFGAKGSMP